MRITDINNAILSRLNSYYHNVTLWLCSIFERLYLGLIGVEVASDVKFRGWTSVFRATRSSIKIGSECSFNSTQFYNHIGLNHGCILSTHRSDAEILIGDGVGMSGTTINSWKSVRIGNNVRIGANVVIMDSDFHLDDARTTRPKEIVIDNNVWLGGNVVVMKGVHIGCNSIIGMNSIVTKDIPANCIAAGNPCKVIKTIK